MSKFLFVSVSALSITMASSALADSNTVYLSQDGNAQQATIDQTGSSNSVGNIYGYVFSQNNGAGSGANVLNVSQSGSGNSIGRDAQGLQSGTGNTAVVYQSGVNSDIELQQTGVQNGVSADWVGFHMNVIQQDDTASSSKLSLYQSGDQNIFNLRQGGYQSNASVTQTGVAGLAFLRQASSDYTSGGANNTAVISQTQATTLVNLAYAVQGDGDWNNLSITQTGDLLGAAFWQSGGFNIVESSQSGASNTIGFAGGTPDWVNSTITPFKQIGGANQIHNVQSGDHNAVNGIQWGSVNFIYTNQSGSINRAGLNQYTSNNTIYNHQYGTNATYNVTQSGDDYNYAYNEQYGDAASASLTQSGYNNSSSGAQIGLNTVTIQQTGSANNAGYHQEGGASATVTQTGNSNTSSGNQYGVNSVGITQAGDNNYASYYQNGAGNAIGLIQTATYNKAYLTQTGAGNIATITQH